MVRLVNFAVDRFRGLLAIPITTALGITGYDQLLDQVQIVYKGASQAAVLHFISSIAKTTLSAMLGYLGPVRSVWDFIFSNPINHQTFVFVRENWFDVAYFMVDLLEPMKRFALADSDDGEPQAAEAEYNRFNELDLMQPMNRHAVISQVQRFAKSLVALFRRPDLGPGGLVNFDMDTVLQSDESARDLHQLSVSSRNGQEKETWLFINGIAGEFHWTTLAVAKLRERFFNVPPPGQAGNCTIKGIFNRSDGMLWDLVECAGERRSDTLQGPQVGINETTESSREAQERLRGELRAALTDQAKNDIIMIAHSQGCLILHLALESLQAEDNGRLGPLMRSRLNVYTFGNPAVDWNVHTFCKHTEHFANTADFVAKLGVLRFFTKGRVPKGSPYFCPDCSNEVPDHPQQMVWANAERKGHLFGSQYSLHEDYACVLKPKGQGNVRSKLLSR